MRTTRAAGLAAGSVFALAASTALAGGMDYSQYSTVKQDGDRLTQSEESVSGERLLNEGDVVNPSGNLEGQVQEVAFNDRGEASFITYSFSDAAATTDNMGYVPFDQAELIARPNDVDVVLPADPGDGSIADRRITEDEAGQQLLSRILESDVMIAGQEHEVEDVLLTKDGRVELALIDADGDAATADRLAVPMDHLQFDEEGRLVSPEDIAPDLLIVVG